MKTKVEINQQEIVIHHQKKQLINIFTIIGCFIFAASALNNYLLNDAKSAFILLGFCFSLMISQVFFYLKKVDSGIGYFFTTIIFAIFYFDSYSGVDSGTFLYFFPLTLGIANLFDYRFKKDQHFLHVLLALIICVAVVNLFTNHALFANPKLTKSQQDQMFVFNLIFALSSLGYFVYLIVNGNLKRLALVEENLQQEREKVQLQRTKNRQNEILLAELQHRLKNNLSLMSSLLNLKMNRNLFDDQEKTNNEVLHAIQTVALGNHVQVFEDSIIHVPIKKYFESIVEDWKKNHVNKVADRLVLHVNDCFILVKQAIPLGLIFHEAICLLELNQGLIQGKLSIYLGCNDKGVCSLRFHVQNEKAAFYNYYEGLNLIELLAEQIDGTIEETENDLICYFEVKSDLPVLESENLFN